MPEGVLAFNAGSSSLKFAFFAGAGADLKAVLRGQITQSAFGHHLRLRDGSGQIIEERQWRPIDEPGADVLALLHLVEERPDAQVVTAVGHRIVHGGRRFVDPVVVDAKVIAAIEALTPLAPLHQPLGLAPVKAIAQARPDVRQICSFDTAFHHGLTPPASRYAIPRHLEAKGIRRYGFHGLSCESIAGQLRQSWPQLAAGRVIVAHLGSGASLTAMIDGHSVDTTMGFSPLDGLVMGTRPGAIDPGVLLHLLRTENLSVDQLEHLLYHECGLLGVSGISSDMAALAQSDDPQAVEAVELFVFRVAREVAALTATLGGLDGLVFTGGIGEHNARIRQMVADRLGWLGVEISPEANRAASAVASPPDSRVKVLVLPTDEEAVIARHAAMAAG